MWKTAAAPMTTWDKAASVVCTAITAVAATARSIRPETASHARAPHVATRKTPPASADSRPIRRVRGAAARVRRSQRSDRARYQ
ncbi:hypothetical protein GCM10010392_65720 [Streptomyces clavifer]|nr:hypothetical protein GCM10010392_65720 [Streptomyces clavifer]